MSYAGATEGYFYDNDGLLTGAGGFTISRYNDPGVNEAGLPYNVTNGAFSLGRAFNGYGETGKESSTVAGYDVYEWNVTDRYADGRIKTKTETIGGVTTTFGYTYDEMGRLETVIKDGSLVESYDYDDIPYGTCTYQMNSLRGIAGRVLDYDAEDHLLSVGGTDYQYDLDGFLTSKASGAETTYYDYSSRGELLSVDLPDGTDITYVHDPLGRRIAKKVNGTITEKYLWSGLTTLLAVYDGSDNLLMRFVYADGRMPVAVEKGGITYYLAYDQVGSLRAVADSSGNVVKEIEYDSFGFVLSDTNPDFEVPFGFAGGLYDKDTGLVRFGYRDYDPDTGRWTAKDPIGFNGGASDLYGYCLNDPINAIDPLGLWQFQVGGGYGIAGYITFGRNSGHWNFGGGVGAGIGLGFNYNPDNSDPNRPITSDPCSNGDASSFGLNAFGFVRITKIIEATAGMSLMAKGDNLNAALSATVSGGAQAFSSLGGGGSLTGELNINSASGNTSPEFAGKLDGSVGLGAFGFYGVAGGYTWK